jgi:hypothetical protein
MARYRTQGEGDFAEIMLDLAQYDYAGLACKALQLLNRVFSASDDLFNNIVKAQVLLLPESIHLKTMLENEMPAIRRLGSGQVWKQGAVCACLPVPLAVFASRLWLSRSKRETRPMTSTVA